MSVHTSVSKVTDCGILDLVHSDSGLVILDYEVLFMNYGHGCRR
jgi:hypothetical protein